MSLRLCSVTLVLATVLAAGCSGGDTAGETATDKTTVATAGSSKITLHGARENAGPWVRSLSLEHGEDGVPVGFYVCAAWDAARAPEACNAAPGAKLPPETILRLEQRPVGSALTKPDSPGWGVVGTSEQAELHVPLSDFVSGVDVGKATYRVTLRSIDGGPALAKSGVFTVTWAK
jgi:hypothetical protein